MIADRRLPTAQCANCGLPSAVGDQLIETPWKEKGYEQIGRNIHSA